MSLAKGRYLAIVYCNGNVLGALVEAFRLCQVTLLLFGLDVPAT